MNAFTTTPRKTLTPQQRAKLFMERGGRCHRCKRKLRPGDPWNVEHLEALTNGGDNDWENLDISCSWCKPAKDRDDHKKAAKTRAVATKHANSGTIRKGRPLPGTKASGWKHKMNGTWERRT